MFRTFLSFTAALAALAVGTSGASGASDPNRDSGDATWARLGLTAAQVQLVHDHGDAIAALEHRSVPTRNATTSVRTAPITVVRDVAVRDARRAAGEAAIAYFKANESLTNVPPSSPLAISRDDFDWGDFGLGAGASLGLALLLGGIAAGLHFGRRDTVPPRTVS